MNEFERKKKEILTPVFFEAGAALHDCQGFEYGIGFLLFHFNRIGVKGLDPDRMEAIMDNVEKKTAGQLITMLKQHTSISDNLEQVLHEALNARNIIIHRVLVDNIECLLDEKDRQRLIKKIRDLRSKIRKADEMLRPFIGGFSLELDGFDANSEKTKAISKLLKEE